MGQLLGARSPTSVSPIHHYPYYLHSDRPESHTCMISYLTSSLVFLRQLQQQQRCQPVTVFWWAFVAAAIEPMSVPLTLATMMSALSRLGPLVWPLCKNKDSLFKKCGWMRDTEYVYHILADIPLSVLISLDVSVLRGRLGPFCPWELSQRMKKTMSDTDL